MTSTWLEVNSNLHHFTKYEDHPKPGITFYDIGGVLAEPFQWARLVNDMSDAALAYDPDGLIAVDARGFLIAAAMGFYLSLPVVMARKPGKLPGNKAQVEYELEYGTDRLELQQDKIQKGGRYIIVDDVLATGGTARAVKQLVSEAGAEAVALFTALAIPQLNGAQHVDLPTVTWAKT